MNRGGTHRSSPQTPAEHPQGHQGPCSGHSIRFPRQRGCSPPGKARLCRVDTSCHGINSQPGLIEARPNTSGKPLGVPKPVQPGSLTPQRGVGATNHINPTTHPRLLPFSVIPGEKRHKTPLESLQLLGMGPLTGVKTLGNSTQNTCKNNSTASNTAPSRWSCLTAPFYPVWGFSP